MPGDELAFYTCEQLIQELMRRTTFYGCIVHAANGHRGEDWQTRVFRVQCCAEMNLAEASRLLETVGEKMSDVG